VDLRTYQPVEVAASLHLPMLIVQGGRDYQVTVEGDFATWQQALSERPDVTMRIYSSDNHFFFLGSGPSAPAESEPAQHVDETVIVDVADWIDSPTG
jgi:dienelactone hydrolase